LLAEFAARASGVREVRMWVVDSDLRQLVPFGNPSSDEVFDIAGTVAGRVYARGQPMERSTDDDITLWVPLLDGINRLGVVRFVVDAIDEARRGTLAKIASILASELVSRGQYTDLVARARRTREMALGAEILHELLRPFSFTTNDVSVAALIAPAYRASGDAYDYAYNDDVLHLAVVDAMGHDVDAALIAHLIVVTCRWCRRRDLSLEATVAEVDAAVARQFPGGRYGTGVLAEIDVRSGTIRWVNNGHLPPIIIRRDRVVGELAASPRPPLGVHRLARSPMPQLAEMGLQPGDRLLLYTDGVTEARRGDTVEPFGVDRLRTFLQRDVASNLPNSEIVRRLKNALLDFHDGELQDDATMMLVQWHPEAAA
jgi:serine phosphatase RsbU (regulator of sigma subunit)